MNIHRLVDRAFAQSPFLCRTGVPNSCHNYLNGKCTILFHTCSQKERFVATPKPLYDEIVKNAQGSADRFAGHAARRAARTSARADVGADEQCESDIAEGSEEDVAGATEDASLDEDVPGAPRDPYVNPDEFKETHSRQKPAGFSTAVRQAREIHIDHMRVLLEAHYDEAHKQRWAE